MAENLEEDRRAEADLRGVGAYCEVCWSNSWSPCPEGTPDAIPDFSTRGWMVCDLCSAQERLRRIQSRLDLAIEGLKEIAQEKWLAHRGGKPISGFTASAQIALRTLESIEEKER